MSRTLLLLAALSLLGCGTPKCVTTVRVVAVQCESRGGAPDCVTTLEDKQGFRYTYNERIGDVGDTFKARIYDGWHVGVGAGSEPLEPCPCVLPEREP